MKKRLLTVAPSSRCSLSLAACGGQSSRLRARSSMTRLSRQLMAWTGATRKT